MGAELRSNLGRASAGMVGAALCAALVLLAASVASAANPPSPGGTPNPGGASGTAANPSGQGLPAAPGGASGATPLAPKGTLKTNATSGATAATTLGQTGTPNTNGCVDGAWLQRATATTSPSYTMPSAGTISSWSYQAGALGGSIRLKVLRPTTNPLTFFVVAESATQTVTINSLNTFSTSIAVQAGDLLTLQTVTGIPGCMIGGAIQPCVAITTSDIVSVRAGDDAPGTQGSFFDCRSDLVDISAVFTALPPPPPPVVVTPRFTG